MEIQYCQRFSSFHKKVANDGKKVVEIIKIEPRWSTLALNHIFTSRETFEVILKSVLIRTKLALSYTVRISYGGPYEQQRRKIKSNQMCKRLQFFFYSVCCFLFFFHFFLTGIVVVVDLYYYFFNTLLPAFVVKYNIINTTLRILKINQSSGPTEYCYKSTIL